MIGEIPSSTATTPPPGGAERNGVLPQRPAPLQHPVGLFLTRNLLSGGAERVFVSLVNNARTVVPVVGLLERRGPLVGDVHPEVRCLSRVDRTIAPSLGARIAPEIPGETFARLAVECRWLHRVARASDATVISSFLMRAHVVALLTKMTLLPHIPVVLNVHEHMTDSAPYLYPRRRDRAMMRWITRHLFPRADRIVVVAADLKRDLVRAHGVPAELIDVVHNPLEISRIRAAAEESVATPWGDVASEQTVVAVGRLVPLKGFDLLLHALERLRRSRAVRLVIVGDGPERQTLQRLASQLGIAEHVYFAGQQSNPWRLMARCDALALTSRTEAFPNVLTEAMALGIPVLATDCSAGVRESLLDGQCGVIVPAEDVTAIANGLDALLADAPRRARLCAAGRARVESFDLPLVQARYESVLTAAIASRGV